MSHLRTSAEGYLATRRALGFKLLIQGRLLEQFVDYLEDRGLETVTAEAAIAWASAPGTSAVWHGMRFGVARRFALHLELLDPRCEVPPFDAVPERYRRLPPHIYSAAEITALMDAARRLHPTLRAATLETVIGLLAVTGMRSGEVLRLNRSEVDLAFGTLRVIATKGNKSRELALHDSSVAALTTYTRLRDEAFPIASSPSFFVSRAGHRLNQSTFHAAFQCVVDAAGLVPPPGSRARRPRPHDMRHSFAVHTVLAWHRAGADVQALLPALSAYLGHVKPKDTYWYLSAVPELLSLVSARAEERRERRS